MSSVMKRQTSKDKELTNKKGGRNAKNTSGDGSAAG